MSYNPYIQKLFTFIEDKIDQLIEDSKIVGEYYRNSYLIDNN